MDYIPKPIDVSDVDLSSDLKALAEKLAENTHEVWAAQRIADGWRYGEARDDTLRTHPCLVLYQDLSEAEKAYDRATSLETIKLLLKLGYQITPPATDPDLHAEGVAAIERQIKEQGNLSLKNIREIWDQRDFALWQKAPQLYAILGHQALQTSEPLFAYDILKHGLDLFDATVWRFTEERQREIYITLMQLQALAMAQSGMPQRGAKLLEELEAHGALSAETKGLLGRCYKDVALHIPGRIDHRSLRKALTIYLDGFGLAMQQGDYHGAFYNGINAATLALLDTQTEKCFELAKQVEEICQQLLTQKRDEERAPNHWLLATLGEANLLQGNLPESRQYYTQAAQACCGRVRDLASMRKQARLILNALNRPVTSLDPCFNTPSVVVFTGHRFDSPDATSPRFPVDAEETVRLAIRAYLKQINAGIAYASAADGADLIFLEEMLRRGGEINIVLPFNQETFFDASVTHAASHSRQRVSEVLARANRIQVLASPSAGDNSALFAFANLVLLGEGRQAAAHHQLEFHCLAMWNGDKQFRLGGTGWTVNEWSKSGVVDVINPQGQLEVASPHATMGAEIPVVKNKKTEHYCYLPMLFADVKGYSQLTELQVVEFSTIFLGKVGEVVERHAAGIFSRRTQGDGLFIVFNNLKTAVHFSRDLNRVTLSTDWSIFGLPENLRFRIALDAGPCYAYTDPILHQREFCGEYVIRAARMEPITPPGEIFASETFVALVKAINLESVQFDYAGQITLPKNYGVIPAYHLHF